MKNNDRTPNDNDTEPIRVADLEPLDDYEFDVKPVDQKKDQVEPVKEGKPGQPFKLDDLLVNAMADENPNPFRQKQRIQRVSELVENDLKQVAEEETMGEKDLAIQSYIKDLEADLDDKMEQIKAEKRRRTELEAELELLKVSLKEAEKNTKVNESIQGYLSDLETDIEEKNKQLELEKKEKDRIEKELSELKAKIDSSFESEKELVRIKKELDNTKSRRAVEVARLEQEHENKLEKANRLKTKVSDLEEDLKKRTDLIDSMRNKISNSEASLIAFKERIKDLENRLETEKKMRQRSNERALLLENELESYREQLTKRSEETEKIDSTDVDLEKLKEQLESTTKNLLKGVDERKQAEEQIVRLRKELQNVGKDMKRDISSLRMENDRYKEDLEKEKMDNAKLEEEIKALNAKVDHIRLKADKDIENMKMERNLFLEENRNKEKEIEAKILELNIKREEVSLQRNNLDVEKAALEKEKASIEDLRHEAEEDLTDHKVRLAQIDGTVKEEAQRLENEKECILKKAKELESIEVRLDQRDQEIQEREDRLRVELNSLALEVPRTSREPITASGPPKTEDQYMVSNDGIQGSAASGQENIEKDEGDAQGLLLKLRGISQSASPVRQEGPRPVDLNTQDDGPKAPPAENVSTGNRIWPPLGISNDEAPVEDTSSIDRTSRPLRGQIRTPSGFAKESYRRKKVPKSVLLWPDSAYEAEARREDQLYYHRTPQSARNRSIQPRKRLLDQYVQVKNEPESRPVEKLYRCLCGTQVQVTDAHMTFGLRCPGCGRKLF